MSDRLEEAREQALVENTGLAVYKYLEQLEHKRSLYQSRWIWELLQNAIDAAKIRGSVRIAFSLDSVSLGVLHDGDPFSPSQIAHLIHHGSTKHGLPDQVGQFGSGFLSTHLLSRQIHARGTLDDGTTFDFTLDRQGNSPVELSDRMKDSWREFRASIQQPDSGPEPTFTTQYSYPLNSQSYSVVTTGLVSLERC